MRFVFGTRADRVLGVHTTHKKWTFCKSVHLVPHPYPLLGLTMQKFSIFSSVTVKLPLNPQKGGGAGRLDSDKVPGDLGSKLSSVFHYAVW